ncbi:DUF4129 domain-containing protein [Salininema proteolyticum]|uniref:DUF4129 domain-containing protein n=1 Tax=Salininema proteolyticum TaxID=1607685 RepID=A0ABV8U083_9ACTN
MRLKRWPLLAALLLTLVAALVFAGGPGIEFQPAEPPDPPSQTPDRPSADGTYSPPPTDTGEPSEPWTFGLLGAIVAALGWTILIAAAAAILGLIAYLVRAWLSDQDAPGRALGDGSAAITRSEASADEAVGAGIEAGLEAVVAETDARRAVIACWQRLEAHGAATGIERGASDTPTDYGVRLLSATAAPETAISGLRDLYLEARFSDHPMDDEARDRARAHLEALRSGIERKADTP